jgi:5'(3')-deoxyribonucleotidase
MTNTSQIAIAARLATEVHSKQFDKIEQPYIEHPRRVYQNLLNHPNLPGAIGVDKVESALAAAWLHDVVEDSAEFYGRSVTLEELRNSGFAADTVEIVRLMTRDLESNRTGDHYYAALAENPAARVVKLADIIDNLQPWRAEQLDAEKAQKLADKYSHALDVLGLTADESEWMSARHSRTLLPELGGRKILYFDMDNVLVDFPTGIARLPEDVRTEYLDEKGDYKDIDEHPGIFGLMDPLPGAVEAFHELSKHFDVYILSTAPWKNPSAWSDKVEWVHRHLGIESETVAHKRLIISHNKHLNRGHFLIDDRPNNGAQQFGQLPGQEWINFGSVQFPGWPSVIEYLKAVA